MYRVQAYILKRNKREHLNYIFYEESISYSKRLTNINRVFAKF